MTWKTKPTDRFVLRFIKINLSSPVSSVLVRFFPGIRPSLLTVVSATVGVAAGVAFGTGRPWLGGLLAAAAQVMDGVDGQVARLTGRVSRRGAFLDSVLDRYMDFSLIFGMTLHCLRFSAEINVNGMTLTFPWIIVVAGLAAAGSSQVSYSTARAAALDLRYCRPELAGKATRTAVIVICGFLTPFWVHFPLLALCYLAVHSNLAVLLSLIRLLWSSD